MDEGKGKELRELAERYISQQYAGLLEAVRMYSEIFSGCTPEQKHAVVVPVGLPTFVALVSFVQQSDLGRRLEEKMAQAAGSAGDE